MKKRKYLLFFVLFGILMYFLPYMYGKTLVWNMRIFRKYNPITTNFIEYRRKQAKFHGQYFRGTYQYVPLSEISPALIKAVIFAEDGNFYKHHGVDWTSIRRSWRINRQYHRKVAGGSTITMQLCKNLFLSPRKTYWRKYVEVILAGRMERTLSKSRILELYLNVIEWGNDVFGIKQAAWYYFQKEPRELDDQESAFLAAIIVNPRWYNPHKPNSFFLDRQRMIYGHLVGTSNVEIAVYVQPPLLDERTSQNTEQLLDYEPQPILSLPEQ